MSNSHRTRDQRLKTTFDVARNIGPTLKAFRLRKGITPRELADDIGMSQYYVLKLEAGAIPIDAKMLDRCAAALSMRVIDIMDAVVAECVSLDN